MRRIFELCAAGFEQDRSPSFKTDVENHVMGETAACFIFQDNLRQLNPSGVKKSPLLAFVSYRTIEVELDDGTERVVYFSAIMIAEEYRGQKVAAGIIKTIMKKHQARYMALRTQNPIMRESVNEACDQVCPGLAEKENPQEFVAIGAAVANMLGMPRYDPQLMTEEGTYGKSLYGKTLPALSGNLMALNAAFWKKVNVRRGDSMIVVGRGIKE